MKVIIYAGDDKKKGTVEIGRYLEKNFDVLLGIGVRFTLKAVDSKGKKQLIKNGITGLPAAIVNGKKDSALIGPTAIKSMLTKVLTSKQPGISKLGGSGGSQIQLSPEEEMREYQRSEMTKEKINRDKEDSNASNNTGQSMVQRANEFARAREATHKAQRGGNNKNGGNDRAGRRPDNVTSSPPAPLNDDDAMIARMLETSEDVEMDYEDEFNDF